MRIGPKERVRSCGIGVLPCFRKTFLLTIAVFSMAGAAFAQSSAAHSGIEVADLAPNLAPNLAQPATEAAEQPPQSPGGSPPPDFQGNPMPATSGTIGIFTVETGQLLQSGWSFSIYGNRFGRMPGSVVVSNYGMNFAWAFSKRLNLYAGFQPDVATQVGDPAELSLDTPSTQPVLFSQYGSTIYRALAPGQSPGYVEDFPFVSQNGSGPGNVTLGAKFGLLSERDEAPLSLSVRNDAIIPTRYTVNSLVGNGTQTGAFQDLILVAASRTFSHLITVAGNFGYQITRNPRSGGVSDLMLADQVHVGGGFILFPARRLQFMSEYNGLAFVGAATPDNTFGARNPIDGVWGLRFFLVPQIAMDVGYRYMLNLTSLDDRSGFVISLGIVSWPL